MLNLNQNINPKNKYDLTKTIFLYSFISIVLIIIFIITPLNNIFILSSVMKIIIIIILGYIFYLNIKQVEILREQSNQSNNTDPDFASQINTNIITSYILSLFIGLLIIFVIRKLF
jgi:Mn2+/Fe2+ NRAMP family transporter